MLNQTKGLSRLIDDLRVLSLSDSGQLYLYRENLQLDQLIAEIVTIFADDIQARAINPVIDADAISVFLDKFRFIQVLVALIGNAIKYSNPGQLLVTYRVNGNHIQITVEDEGPGIDVKDVERLFDAFYRVNSSRTNETDGSGLGLAVVS